MSFCGALSIYFNPLAPCGARLGKTGNYLFWDKISIHSPHAGRDDIYHPIDFAILRISIHSPRAGRDLGFLEIKQGIADFNPLAPYGARQRRGQLPAISTIFQSTRPIWSETEAKESKSYRAPFQSTRPVRGETVPYRRYAYPYQFQSTRPVRGETMRCWTFTSKNEFQSTRPVRGETRDVAPVPPRATDFNPLAPYGARPLRPIIKDMEQWDFNPLAPYGARRHLGRRMGKKQLFQSTRPIWGETAKIHNTSVHTFAKHNKFSDMLSANRSYSQTVPLKMHLFSVN